MEIRAESWGGWFTHLDLPFEHALARLPDREPVVVLFSGGVDSGLLAWELRHRPGTKLATFGLEGSLDVAAATERAKELGLPWTPSCASPEEVRRRARELVEWVGPLSPTERSIETAFSLAAERAPPGPLVCGQGADELFFGYAHYRSLAPGAAAQRAEADLAALLAHAWPREQQIGRHLGRMVCAPYLDPEFVAAARSVPASDRLAGDPPKALFRAWARRRGLPPEIADRPKKALQFGSGVARLLRRRMLDP